VGEDAGTIGAGEGKPERAGTIGARDAREPQSMREGDGGSYEQGEQEDDGGSYK
jgi:hypothetical protein